MSSFNGCHLSWSLSYLVEEASVQSLCISACVEWLALVVDHKTSKFMLTTRLSSGARSTLGCLSVVRHGLVGWAGASVMEGCDSGS